MRRGSSQTLRQAFHVAQRPRAQAGAAYDRVALTLSGGEPTDTNFPIPESSMMALSEVDGADGGGDGDGGANTKVGVFAAARLLLVDEYLGWNCVDSERTTREQYTQWKVRFVAPRSCALRARFLLCASLLNM